MGSLTDGQEFSPTISPNISVISRGSEVHSSHNQSNNTVFPKPQDEHNLIGKSFILENIFKKISDYFLNNRKDFNLYGFFLS